jgi:SAM-dependent methyltransferase
MLSREQVKSFYDRSGARQDRLAFYEDPPAEDLIAHADFENARLVYEFGCGTGRFAENILARRLPQNALYYGVDLSPSKVQLARERLARFGNRAMVVLTDGSSEVRAADGSVDRFVSNYVLDLLPAEEIHSLLAEAHRVLAKDGRLCLISLTHGKTRLSRLVIWGWVRLHSVRPILVGGCRPIELLEFLREEAWQLRHVNVVTAFGIPSEIVVALPRSDRNAGDQT